MKVTMSEITKIRIEGAPALDPIDVFLEDHGPKQGSITIKCYGESWTTYWGGIWEGLTVAQFFCKANDSYVIDRLWPAGKHHMVPDWDALEPKLKTEVIQLRRKGALEKGKARELFNSCDQMYVPGDDKEQPDSTVTDLITEILDYCWWDHIPEKVNHEYAYLCRIVSAVREALSSIDQKAAA